ncbi:MAG: hypothetical protein IH616_00770 [Gemmatimonadales bacterium]|nr:hypothetical protein [Gemmatimonadales bacterium]
MAGICSGASERSRNDSGYGTHEALRKLKNIALTGTTMIIRRDSERRS